MTINYREKIREATEKISELRRRDYWRKIVKNNLSISNTELSKHEKKVAREFFEKYEKIDISFHQFYKNSTGKFYENYIPDDLYYCKIDPYYNNWELAEYIDNKCYYDIIFSDVDQPVMKAKRMNGIWFVDKEIVTLWIMYLNYLKGKKYL